MSSSRAIIKSFKAIGITTGLNPAKVSGSMGADIAGPVMVLDKVDQVAIQIKWTSVNAVGVIQVQGSNDPILANPGADPDDAQWDALTFDPELAQPNSDNGQYLVNLALIPFTYLRIFYDRTSGTGSLTAFVSAKGL